MLRLTVALLTSVVALAAKKDAIKEEKNVLVLTEANFDEAIKAHDPLLVEFYAPWCGHCKSLEPEYAAAAGELKSDGIRVAKVDATVEKSLAERYGVTGFPTLKYIKGGKPIDYNGGRTKSDIVSWLRKRAGPAAKTLASAAELTAFLSKNPVSVVVFGAPAGSPAAAAALKAADATEDVPFAFTDAADARAAHADVAGAGGAPATAVAFNDFEGEATAVAFTGDVTDASALGSFASSRSLPLVIPFTSDSAPKIFRGTIKSHFLVFIDVAEPAGAALLPALRETAATHRGELLVVTVGSSEDRVLSFFGVTKADFPAAVGVTMPADGQGAMKKFKYTGAFEAAAFDAFITDFLAGSLKPFLKSEPAPDAEAEAKAPVKTVTGENFAAVVLDESKDVLFEIYAPWCGHCKKLAPEYDALGEAVVAAGAADKITIAKSDGTANEFDHPGVNVKGFPTLLFKPAGAGAKIVDYDGARDQAGMLAFLKKHATNAAALGDADASDDETDEEL